jgi:hypothetical protein
MTDVEMASLAGLIFSQLPPNQDALGVLRIADELVRKYYLPAEEAAQVIRLVPTALEAR